MGALEITCIVLAALIVVVSIVNIVVSMKIRKAEQQSEDIPAAEPAKAEEPKKEEVPEVAEVVEEAAPAAEPAKEEVAPVKEEKYDHAQTAAVFASGEVSETDSGAVVRTTGGEVIYLMYNKSFKAKLIQGKDEVREYYNRLKNYVLSYDKVTTRISWSHESVNHGREKICWFVLRGKSLYLYLPLNPDDYAESKYKVERAEAKRFEELPCLYKIKNPRRAAYAEELIATVMEKFGLERTEGEPKDYIKDYPYENTLPLVKRGLIKVTRSNRKVFAEDLTEEEIAANKMVITPRAEVRVQEVNEIMTDEVAEAMVEHGARKADTTKKGIINIDVLSKYFSDGEKVTVEEIKKRIKDFDKKVTYVKVLARGTLNKRLTVEADEFSVEAAKMILLTGGKVIKTIP